MQLLVVAREVRFAHRRLSARRVDCRHARVEFVQTRLDVSQCVLDICSFVDCRPLHDGVDLAGCRVCSTCVSDESLFLARVSLTVAEQFVDFLGRRQLVREVNLPVRREVETSLVLGQAYVPS